MTEWLLLKRQEITGVGENMEKREPLCTIGGDVNWCTTMKNSMELPQKIKNRTAILSSNSTSGYLPEENFFKNFKKIHALNVHL